MLKFKTSCAVLAYLSSNLLNEVGLSLFRYFEVGLRVYDIVVKKFTFAISSPLQLSYSSTVSQKRCNIDVLYYMIDTSQLEYALSQFAKIIIRLLESIQSFFPMGCTFTKFGAHVGESL